MQADNPIGGGIHLPVHRRPQAEVLLWPEGKENIYFGPKNDYFFFFQELLIPAYKSMATAFQSHPDASVMITFASMRSVFDTVLEALQCPQIRVIAIIAEGVPENQTRKLIRVGIGGEIWHRFFTEIFRVLFQPKIFYLACNSQIRDNSVE